MNKILLLILFSCFVFAGPIHVCNTHAGVDINLDGNVNATGNTTGCFIFTADDVTLNCNGYTIYGTGVEIGVNNNGFKNVTVKNCIIKRLINGITYSNGANNATIYNNTVFGEIILFSGNGIIISNSDYANISNNTIWYNYNNLQIYQSNYARVLGNNMSYSLAAYGIHLLTSNYSVTENNIIAQNGAQGILVADSWFNNFTGNTVYGHSLSYGILINLDGNENRFTGNRIFSNGVGVFLDSGSDNIFDGNIINQSQDLNISVGTLRNLFYDNYFYNGSNNYIATSGSDLNDFNTTVSGVAHGNYYEDILSYNIFDANADGYGDSGTQYPYNSTVSSKWIGSGNDYGPIGAKVGIGGCGTITTSGSLGVDIYATGNCFILNADDIEFNCAGYSIYGDGTGIGINSSNYKNITIKNCFISNFSKGSLLSNSNYSKILNSTFFNNTDSGISLWDGIGLNISWSNFSYNTGPAINVSTNYGNSGYLNDSIFQNNTFLFNDNSYHNAIGSINEAGGGFYVLVTAGDFGKRVNNATFYNNYFEGNLDRGISLTAAHNTNVSYNYFVRNTVNRTDSCGAAIYMDGTTTNTTIIGNHFIDQQLYDICSNSLNNPALIYNNTFSLSERGVRVSRYSNVSYNNFNELDYVILMLSSSSKYNIIQGNTIRNSVNGLYFTGSYQKAYNNTLYNVTGEYFYTSNSNISYNIFEKSETDLFFQNPASNNVFHGNTINIDGGLYVTAGAANNKFYGNTFQNASAPYFVTNYDASNDFDYNGVGNYYPDILDWEIRDVDGNGYGDSGFDYPYSATTYPSWYTTQTPFIGLSEDNYPATTKRLCGNLWYPITINVNGTVAPDCLNITADDVVINCNNNTITGIGVGYFLNVTNYSYFELINCNLVNFDVGIYLQNTTGFLSWNSTYRSITTDFHAIDSNGTVLNGEALNAWVTNPSSTLSRQWTTYIYVHHGLGAILGATVNVINVIPKWLGTIYTGADGYTIEQSLEEYFETDGHTAVMTPHTFNASKIGYNYTTASATINHIQLIDMEIEGEAPPTIILNSPTDFSWTNSSVLFSCTANDYNLDTVILYGDWTGSWSPNMTNITPISGIPNTFLVNDIPEGIWKWNCLGNDTVNQSAFGSLNYTFSVDSINPAVSIISPVNGTFVNGIVNIQTVPSDIVGINYVKIEYKESTSLIWNTICIDYFAPYSCNWDTSDIIEYMNSSIWNIKATAVDLVNNTGESGIYNYIIDKQIPQVWGHVVTYPMWKTTANNGDIVNFEVNVLDEIAGVDYVILNASEINGSFLNMSLIMGEMSPNITGSYSIDVVIDGAVDGIFGVPIGVSDLAVPTNQNNNTQFIINIDTSGCANITTNTTLTADIVSSNPCFNIVDHNVTFDCNGYGIYGDNGIGDYAIGVWSSPAIIKNCYIQDLYYGIINFRSHNTLMTNNTFYHNYYGYFDEQSSGTIIQNSNFSNGNLTAIHAYYGANRITVENSNFEDTTNGLVFVATSGTTQDYTTIRNNTFSNSGALMYAQEDANVTNNSFDTARLMYAQDSSFYDNSASGTVDFVGDSFCAIYDNDLNGDVYFSDSFNNRIFNHVVDGTTEWSFWNTADRIFNNNFTEDSLLWIENSQNVISNNIFYNMDGAATYLYYSYGSGDNVSYNTFYNNTKYFIFAESDEAYPYLNNTFAFNNMTSNDYGLSIYSQRTKVYNNTFIDNGAGHGILGFSILDSGWHVGTPNIHGHSNNEIYYNTIVGENGIKKIYGNSSIWGNTINYSGIWAFNFVGNYYSNDEVVLIYNNTLLGSGAYDVYSYTTTAYPQIINISNTNININKINIIDTSANAEITVEYACYPQVINNTGGPIAGATLNYIVYNSLWGSTTSNTTTNATGYSGERVIARLGTANNNSGTGLVWVHPNNIFYASKPGLSSNTTNAYPWSQDSSVPIVLVQSCIGGIPFFTCSPTQPLYCTGAGALIDNCTGCGCATGYYCGVGDVCYLEIVPTVGDQASSFADQILSLFFLLLKILFIIIIILVLLKIFDKSL